MLGSANPFMVFAAVTFVQIRIGEHLKNLFVARTTVLIPPTSYDKLARMADCPGSAIVQIGINSPRVTGDRECESCCSEQKNVEDSRRPRDGSALAYAPVS